MSRSDDACKTPRRRRQFSLRTLLLVTFCLAILIGVSTTLWREFGDPLRHIRHFHRTIARADRIVIRGGEIDDSGPDVELSIVYDITDQAKVAEVREHIQFLAQPPIPPCFCYGYPEIDWYRGDERLMRTTLKHNQSLEWPEIVGSAMLTPESSLWIVEWLAKIDGVPVAATGALPEGEDIARQKIRSLMPTGFWEGVVKAEADTASQLRSGDLASMESLEDLKDRYVRALCADRAALCRGLFQVMGAVPGPWESLPFAEVIEAHEFLTRVPRHELEQAFRSAAVTEDRMERHGAVRIVFSQHFMTLYGKTEADLVRWMDMFAGEAYSEFYPENRRILMRRLVEYPQVRAGDVLARAIEDPDAQVRRRAIDALRLRGGTEAVTLLRRVASGQTKPRRAKPVLYPPGSFTNPRDRSWEDDTPVEGSDAEAAEKALRTLGR